VAALVVTVKIEEPVPGIEAGLKLVVTPAGAPLTVALSSTDPANPLRAAVEMV
jgi:hypothetical protein